MKKGGIRYSVSLLKKNFSVLICEGIISSYGDGFALFF